MQRLRQARCLINAVAERCFCIQHFHADEKNAPYGFPALSGSESASDGVAEFDNPEEFIADEAAKLRAGRALYDALPISSRPALAVLTRKLFDFVFHYGETPCRPPNHNTR